MNPINTNDFRARGYHVRELYRVISCVRDRLREGDSASALAICEMIDEQPPANARDLSPEEFAQAFEG